ncbi:MAG: homocysteine S-methyltransferase family protein [Planctomycetota bacterium]
MTLADLLRDKTILLSDGAWGTELAKRGLASGEVPELWNLNRPDDVMAVARGYVDAGSDIILTNTFGGSRWKLEKAHLADRTAEFNQQGTAISKRAARDKALVFASIGPTGEFMQPLGLKTEEEFVMCFAEQIRACAAGGADGIVVETQTDLGEAKAALKAARQVGSLPVVVSMTFDSGPRGFATMMGIKPEQAAAELSAAGADAVGANCGAGIDNMIQVTRLMRSATHIPLWIKSNAGMPELVGGRTVFRETPDQMAAKAPRLVEAGASIIGGCCGTTLAHIRQMREALDRFRT